MAKDTGVIVESSLNGSDPIAYTIVDFTKKKSVYVRRSNLEYFENEGSHEVFENVNYVADENGYVRDLTSRKQKKLECFIKDDDVFVVKTFCVFSHDEPARCYTDVVGEIPCNPIVYSKVLCRNVTFDCYVQLKFTRAEDFMSDAKDDVTFELYEIEGVDPEKFDCALQAPWLSHAKRPMYEVYDPFVSEIDRSKEKNMTDIFGVLIAGNTIYLPSKPRWKVSLAYDEIGSLKTDVSDIEPGMPVSVKLRFNYILDRYIVYDITQRVSKTFQGLRIWNRYFLRAALTTFSEMHGYFIWQDRYLVFDKYGLLSNLYGKSLTAVADFGYMDSDEHAYTTLVVKDANEDNWLDIKDSKFVGLCINKNEFYCSQLHHYLLFSDENFEVGSWYDLECVNIDYNNFCAKVIPTLNVDKEPTLYKTIPDGYEFLVRCEWHREGAWKFLFGDQIGVIGVTGKQIPKPDAIENKACAVRFGKPVKDYLQRPQVRPKLVRYYRDYDETSRVDYL